MLRSIVAVIAGSITWMITALGTNSVLMSLMPTWFGENGKIESVPLMFFILLYSLLFSVLGGFVTATIAKRKEIQHALVLGVLQLALGIAATVQFYDAAPLWYHTAFLTLLVPANVFGGQLRTMQKRKPGLGARAAI